MEKCEYFNCNNEVKREIKTTFENKPYIIKVCRKCYIEYLKA